ncbi:MAG TPA: ice-binding family protein [Xanthomonadaceae bacterium]|nr:ice-binding family protein [Xanthomonadaceae bacterium]
MNAINCSAGSNPGRVSSIFCSSTGRRAIAGGVGLLMLVVVALPLSAQNVALGTAADFGVLGGQEVTNIGPTVVTGSVGVSPGSSITGFPPGSIAPGSGTFHVANAVALQAQADLTIAYDDAAGRTCDTPIAGGLLGGLTLGPGVYCMDVGSLVGTLTLDGTGVYIFQMASSLITAPGAEVVLQNGAEACGVWWQVTSSATLDTTTDLAGNVLALTSITLNDSASVNGRVLARNGTVTLSNNQVTACSGGPEPPVGPPGPGPGLGPVPEASIIPAGRLGTLILLGTLLAILGVITVRSRQT